MIIQAFPSGPFQTNAYVIGCPVTRDAAIVDPAPDSAEVILEFLQHNKLKAKQILLTHSHWDHISDIAALKASMPLTVSVHSSDKDNLQKPGSDQLPYWIPFAGIQADRLLEDGDAIEVGNIHFRVIHTPGHSPGSVCFYCDKEHVLISGDTLFKGTIGNLTFPTSIPEAMWPSLDKLAALPHKTKVYPGHGPSTTIGAEEWLPKAKEYFENESL